MSKGKKSKLTAYVLIDRTGSMSGRMTEAVGATNAYIEGLDPDTDVFVASFDDGAPFQVVREVGSASKCEKLSILDENLIPRGYTPLYDSTAKLLDRALSDGPEKAVIVVNTDGHENASREYDHKSVKARIDSAKAMGWQVVFLGQDFDAVSIADSFGIKGSSINTSQGNYEVATMSLCAATRSYGASGKSVNWTEEDRAAAIGNGKGKTWAK
jgi:hypothetical protein